MARTSDARSKNGSAFCRSLSRMPSQACGRTSPRRAISYFATPASSAYPANPSWAAYLREIEVGVPPIAVRPDGSSALSRIRAKSGQTFAESPGEAYLAARRSYLLGFLLGGRGMRRIALTTLILALLCNFAAAADYRITQDYGGAIDR